ncbi:MAG: hypothetical protein AAFO94_17250, partial [Bacteroidota bacterium]
ARGGDAAASPIDRLMRNFLFVPPSMGLPDLLLKMQTTRNHLAIHFGLHSSKKLLVQIQMYLGSTTFKQG